MLPKKPGIYLYFDKTDELLYVGKAKNLKSRVASYFSGNLFPKTAAMVAQIDHVRYLPTESETDALLLEAEVVRKLQPKYNSELKDNKSYPRVKIVDNVISVVHNENYPKAKYFGPYPEGGKIRLILRQIRKVFPYYSQKHKVGEICFRGHIGICPCGSDIKPDMRSIIKILSGKRLGLISDLNLQMKLEAKKQNYEESLKIKNQIDLLSNLGIPTYRPWEYETNPNLIQEISISKVIELCNLLKITYKDNFRIEGYDISHVSGTNVVASMVVNIDGVMTNNNYRRFKIKINKNDDPAAMNEVISRRFNHTEWSFPDVILVDGPIRNLEITKGAIIIGLEKRYETIVLSDGSKLRLPRDNKALNLLQLIRDESHRFAKNYHRKLRSKDMIR